MSAAGNRAPFAARTVLIVVAVAVVGFVSFLLLSAYAPDFRPTRNGGTHALSTSAVGFAGTAELIRMTHGNVGLIRDQKGLDDLGLVVLTPGPETSPDSVKQILAQRDGLMTLIVLPKWIAGPLRGNPAWVAAAGMLPGDFAKAPLEGTAEATLSEGSPANLRVIKGPKLNNDTGAPDGGPFLAELGDSGTYILADPDVINNHGLATREGAERAMAIIDWLTPPDHGVSFDLTLMGFGRNPNLIKLAFEPPFLPLTLCILLAAALAGLHAARRFGPAAHEERAVAFGKRALAENGAALFRLARRRHRTGGRYAQLTRDAVAAATGAPAGLTGEALDRYLDRLDRTGEPFTAIAARAAEAPDTRRLLAAARDLYLWRRTVTREH